MDFLSDAFQKRVSPKFIDLRIVVWTDPMLMPLSWHPGGGGGRGTPL